MPSTSTQGTTRDLTPLAGVTAYIHDLVLDQPGVAAIAINDRDKAWHDVYRIDIRTGERELIVENTQELASIVLDRQLRPGSQPKSRPEGGSSVFRIDGTALELIRVVDHEDDLTTSVHGFTRDGKTLYLISSVGPRQGGLDGHGLGDRHGKSCWRSIPKPTSRAFYPILKPTWWKRPAPNTSRSIGFR